jgi:hypothetical protein
MHTLKIISGGFLLLGVFLLASRYLARGTTGTAAKYFIPVWFGLAGINMWRCGVGFRGPGTECGMRHRYFC